MLLWIVSHILHTVVWTLLSCSTFWLTPRCLVFIALSASSRWPILTCLRLLLIGQELGHVLSSIAKGLRPRGQRNHGRPPLVSLVWRQIRPKSFRFCGSVPNTSIFGDLTSQSGNGMKSRNSCWSTATRSTRWMNGPDRCIGCNAKITVCFVEQNLFATSPDIRRSHMI